MGADPDHVDSNGQTPLYYAVKSQKLDTVEFLLTVGSVDVNHEDNKHETPMNVAKRAGKKQMINLLLMHGAKALDEIRK